MSFTNTSYETYKNIPIATYGFLGIATFVLATVTLFEAGEDVTNDLSLTSQLPNVFSQNNESIENTENNDSSYTEDKSDENVFNNNKEILGGKKNKKTRNIHKKLKTHNKKRSTHKNK